MTKSQRLEMLVKVTDRIELGAAKVLIEQRRHLADAESKLTQLLGYQDEYSAGLSAWLTGSNAAQIKSHHLFLVKLNEAVVTQREQIARIRHVYEEKRHQWYLARRKSAAADKIALKHYQLQNNKATSRERNENDECAQRLFLDRARLLKPPHS